MPCLRSRRLPRSAGIDDILVAHVIFVYGMKEAVETTMTKQPEIYVRTEAFIAHGYGYPYEGLRKLEVH